MWYHDYLRVRAAKITRDFETQPTEWWVCSVLFSHNTNFRENIKTYSTSKLSILVLYVFTFSQKFVLWENKTEQTAAPEWAKPAILRVISGSTDRRNVTQGQIARNLETEHLLPMTNTLSKDTFPMDTLSPSNDKCLSNGCPWHLWWQTPVPMDARVKSV